jgi:hypothetical protein
MVPRLEVRVGVAGDVAMARGWRHDSCAKLGDADHVAEIDAMNRDANL